MVEVPANRLLDAFLEACLRIPADLSLDLVRGDRVSAVMALTVCDILDKVFGYVLFSRIVICKLFAKCADDRLNDLDILSLVVAADIICLKESALLLDHIDALAVIFNIEPVTYILAVAVNRQGFSVKSVIDHERDQLLRELIRTVVVAAVRNVGRELIRVHKCLDHKVRGRLAR